MTINYDCLRAVMLSLENRLTLNEKLRRVSVEIYDIAEYEELKSDYSAKDIVYSVHMLIDAGFLQTEHSTIPEKYQQAAPPPKILTITYKGHEFIEHMKNDNVWNKVKNTAKEISVFSLSALMEIAATIVTEMIRNKLS